MSAFEFKIRWDDEPYERQDVLTTVSADDPLVTPTIVAAVARAILDLYGVPEVRINRLGFLQGHYYPKGFNGTWEEATIDVCLEAGEVVGFKVATAFPTEASWTFVGDDNQIPNLYSHALTVAAQNANSVWTHPRVGLFVQSHDDYRWVQDSRLDGGLGRTIARKENYGR